MPASDLGHFGAAFVENFFRARQGKQDREEQQKQNKLILKLMEGQLQDEASRREAIEFIGRKMSGEAEPIPQIENTAPPGELGSFETVGETPSGIRGPGMSLSEMLAGAQINPKIATSLVQSGMLPQLQGIQQMGAREDFASSLDDPVASGAIRAGMDPSALFQQVDPQASALNELTLALRQQQLADAQRASASEQTAAEAAESSAKSSAMELLADTSEMMDLLEYLGPTLLATGSGVRDYATGQSGGALSALAGPLGFDLTEFENQRVAAGRLDKLMSEAVIANLEKLEQAGTITDTKFQQLKNSLLNADLPTGANLLVAADLAEAGMKHLKNMGVEIENEAEIRERVESIRREHSPVAGSGNLDASAISRMSLEDLRGLISRAQELPTEVLRAAEQRWNELAGK